MISGSEYYNRWYNYASQFHSDVNVPTDVSKSFNWELLSFIQRALRDSLYGKQDLASKKTSPQHWDRVVEVLYQMDAETLSRAWIMSHQIVTLWFDVWKVSS
jgi:hypothetical protein